MSDAIREAVSVVLLNAANYPDNAVAGIWGADMGPLIEQVTASVAGVEKQVRADERANVDAELAMLRRAGKTLGTQLERAGRAIQGAVNRPDLLTGDGEGDWELVFELLAGLRPRAEVAEQALADERAKRPDREHLTLFATDAMRDAMNKFGPYSGSRQGAHIADALMEAGYVVEPEAREESCGHPNHGNGDHNCRSFLTPEAREVTDADDRELLGNLIPLGFSERDGVSNVHQAADRILEHFTLRRRG